MRSRRCVLVSVLFLCVVYCGACRKEATTENRAARSHQSDRADDTKKFSAAVVDGSSQTAPVGHSAASPPTSQSVVESSAGQSPATATNAKSGSDASPPADAPRSRPKYRPSDTRPSHNDEKLAQVGIQKYESKRLRLYTDIDPAATRSLLPLADQIYDAWTDYFGPLPPNPEGTEYQMTGYIMTDREKFRAAGLMPDDLPEFDHGRHRAAMFWIDDQKYDYYRAHLMLHEATHCFMTTLPNVVGPVWYFEGMAESFGTHRVDPDGKAHFRVMPDNKEHFAGWGRISLIQEDVQANGYRTADEIARDDHKSPATNLDYSWWWALCQFLDSHPRYRDRFREVGRRLMAGEQFATQFRKQFDPLLPEFWTDWPLFATELEYGYDFERSAVEYQTGTPLDSPERRHQVDIRADRGWQSSGVLVEAGVTYEVAASGQFTVAREPKPWVSEANGISFRYCRGRPLGLLLGAIRSEPPSRDVGSHAMLQIAPIGSKTQFTASQTGTLYLRINDFPSELKDNTGQLHLIISQAPERREQRAN